MVNPFYIIKKSDVVFVALFILFSIAYNNKSYAQLCTGSLGDPIVTIDFGSGTATHSGALASGTTSYTYTSADFPSDGYYTVENTTAGAGNVWWSTTDHTGNSGGYMMVVNAAVAKTDYFYKSTVTGLCPGTTFEFAAWVVNLLRSQDISPPDITFTILTTSGTVLATYDTGIIPLTPSGPTWKQYGMYFTTPAGVSDVVVQMTNNSNGGAPANDLALDDITFRPCGPTMLSSFSTASTVTTQTACAAANQTFTLTSSVSTGYVSPVYQWQINSGSAWTNITGATTTTYTVTQPTTAGTYEYRLVSSEAANAGTAACEVASNVLTLTVLAAPTAAFSASSTTPCLGDNITFTDNSTATGATISSWLWNFGDGQTSTTQNPTHLYTAAGDFSVQLTVTTANGCTATSPTQNIHIDARPIAAFTTSSVNCAGQAVTFTDSSTPTNGTIKKWVWSYGDSSTDTLTNSNTHTHTYTASGTYTVTLLDITANGCLSNVASQSVVVHPLPIVDFVLPDVCQDDFYSQFTDETTITDNTQSSFAYLWNFGDSKATTTYPNTSTLQNPKHHYSDTGKYVVTLTVTSKYGCVSAVKSQTLTVNGAVSSASFITEGAAYLCSADSVIFDNTSTVEFGNITKVVFYYDYINAPTDSSVYYRSKGQIPTDNLFKHYYGLFNSPVTKNYQVRMIVYSGSASACYKEYDQTIQVNANPIVTLSTIGSLCQLDSPVQITENKNGFTGTGVFSGTGVSSTGLFNPTTAGPGTFTLSYLFTTTSTGCTYSTTRSVTVYANPVITLASSITMLEGSALTIPAKVSGDSLTYAWSPATGLDKINVLNPTATPANTTLYTLTATSGKGCTAAATINVIVLKTPVIPNTFTPNNDGINDVWNIKYLDTYPNCTVEIYSRYGEKLYSSVGYSTPWDGRYKGADLPVGVYYYVINPKSGRSTMSGSVTILR